MMAATVTPSRPFHFIIFGASGFTGRFVVEELARFAAESPGSSAVTWAVAGRSRPRLEETLRRAAERLSIPELATDIKILLADVFEEESLANMCQQGVVILNCVGPYRFYGEPVIKACIENGAHCIDICGEPQFLELMQLEHHKRAMDKGVYVIGSCGFDSVPADLGMLYTQKQFKGTLTAVESFLNFSSGSEGICAHDTIWKSLVYGFARNRALRQLRRKPLPVVGAKVEKRAFLFFSKEVEEYTVPFMGSDPSVVGRTQRFFYEDQQHLPVQYSAFVGVGNLLSVGKLVCGGLLFWLMVKFSLGRKLLTRFPSFFSWGLFSARGPTMKQIEETSFCLTFYGEGYSGKTNSAEGRPDAKICTRVVGAEPRYVATASIMVQAALTLLHEVHSLPRRGGVYTPGAAFHRTSLIERLHRHGIKFSVRNRQ